MIPGFQRTAGHLVRCAHQLHDTIFTQETGGLDITAPQFSALRALWEFPDIDQTTLARIVAYDRATIGGLVERLADKGLIRRTIDKRDRRARTVRLTANGRALFERMHPMMDAVSERMLARLALDEREQLLALLEKMLEPEVELESQNEMLKGVAAS